MLTREVMEEQQITNHTLAIKRMVMTVAMMVMTRMITTDVLDVYCVLICICGRFIHLCD